MKNKKIALTIPFNMFSMKFKEYQYDDNMADYSEIKKENWKGKGNKRRKPVVR